MVPTDEQNIDEQELLTLLTVREAAESLKISEVSVRRLLASGQLSAYKVGRNWRIPRKSILDYLTTNTILQQTKGE